MPMTPFDIGNTISHSDIQAGVRRGRQLRARAVQDVVDRMFNRPTDHREAKA